MSTYDDVRERLSKYRLEKAKKEQTTGRIEESQPIQDTESISEQSKDFNSATNDLPASVVDATAHFTGGNNKAGWALFALKILLWCTLQALFNEIEFGVAFFVASCLFFIVWSLKGSRRNPSQLSAYSVFNKDFEQLQGTLTAEQFEREIRHGPTSVH